MDDFALIIGFAVLAAGIIWSRLVSERAFQNLNDADKIRVMNEFSGMRIWNIIPVIVIVLVMSFGERWLPGHTPWVLGAYLLALVAYFAAMHALTRKKMIKAGAPTEYISMFMKARWISYLSLIAMIAVFIGSVMFNALANTSR